MRIFVRLVLIVTGVVISVLAYTIYNLSFEEMRLYVTPVKIYKTVWGEELEGTRFNYERYLFLRKAILLLYGVFIILVTIIFFKLSCFMDSIKKIISFLWRKVLDNFKSLQKLTTLQKVLLLFAFLTVLIFKIYLLFLLEGDNDELRSYEYFVSQGFWITITYYPDTNNHIFYNLVCMLFDLFMDNGLMVMRIPALLSNLLVLIIIFFIAFRKFGFAAAFIALSLSSFIYEAAYFGVIGRGHLLMCSFAFIALMATWSYIYVKPEKVYLFLLVLCSVLGFYTVPTYLFFLVSLLSFALLHILIHKRYHLLMPFVLSGLLIGLFTFICYLPIILINGIEVLTDHRWVQSLSMNQFLSIFPVYMKELPEYMLGLLGHVRRSYLFATFLMLVFFIVYGKLKEKEEERRWLTLLLVFFVVIVVMLLGMKLLPPYRVFTYFIFILYIGIGILINYSILLFKWKEKNQYLFLVLFFLLFLGIGVKSFVF